MKHRLPALAIAAALFATAPLALADIPAGGTGGTASATGGSGGTGGTGSDTDESKSGCAAARTDSSTSPAIVLVLGLLAAVPLARRRSRTR
jgi:MYXO-CTERM domain-containing protein